jgi:hypothetical protein
MGKQYNNYDYNDGDGGDIYLPYLFTIYLTTLLVAQATHYSAEW